MAEAKQPPRDRVVKAVAKARSESGGTGSVLKVLYLDDAGEAVGEWSSSQLPENPFAGQTIYGLQEPPFAMEQLVYLAETHPVHSAALEQKTADICGKGWEWHTESDEADENQKDELETWFQGLSPDEVDMHEILTSIWLDVETTGWGLLEMARDPSGVLQRVYHVPSHTVRAHKDGFRLCQMRDSRKVWFKRWGSPLEPGGGEVKVDAKTGSRTKITLPANELFVVKRPSRRSTWYGIPGYVSSIGWITLALAARDDNLMFFSNRREPRWAIILSNLTSDSDIEEDLRRAFTVDLRQPHRNIIVPITGPGKIDFQQLTGKGQGEGSFERLGDRADRAVMIAHRVPASRLANTQVGPLGGNSSEADNTVYKEGVIVPGQELFNSRLNRLISVEFPRAQATATPTGKSLKRTLERVRKAATDGAQDEAALLWKLLLDDLDVGSDRAELDQTVIAFHGNLITLREARAKIKLGPLEVVPMDETGNPMRDPVTGEPTADPVQSPHNDLLFTELPGTSGQAGPVGSPPRGSGGLNKSALGDLEAGVRELLLNGRELHERLSAPGDD